MKNAICRVVNNRSILICSLQKNFAHQQEACKQPLISGKNQGTSEYGLHNG